MQDANEKVNLLVNAREAIQGPEQSRKKKNKKNPEEEQLALEKAQKFHDDFVKPALQEVEDLKARLHRVEEESIANHEKEVSFLRRSTDLLKYAGSHPGTLEKLRY